MFGQEGNPQQGNDEPNLALIGAMLGIVVFIVVILYIHGSFLAWYDATDGGSPVENSMSLWVSQIQGESMSDEETRATNMMYLALGGLLVIGGAGVYKGRRYYYKWKDNRIIRNRFSSEQGTAKWEGLEELKPFLGKDGVIVGYKGQHPVRMSLKTSCEHTAIIGPTGCGKTTSIFMPNLLTLPENTSAIVVDPKKEIEEVTGPVLRSRGWETYRLNLDQDDSVIYNPLSVYKNETEIAEIADIILRNGYSSAGDAGDTQWINFAQPLLEAAFWMNIGEAEIESDDPTVFPSIQGAVEIVTSFTEEQRAEMAKLIGGFALERYLAYAQSIQSPETAASIKTVLVSSLRLFSRQDVVGATKGAEAFDPATLRKKPSVFFVQIPERKMPLMKALTATLFWQVIEHIVDEPGLPVVFLLDEFANIGQIPGFAQAAATVRSRKMSLNIAIQGVEQLAREYSKEEQQDILNNMKTKIYFPASTGESGQYVSDMVGHSTVNYQNQRQRRELMTADEVRRIPDGRLLLLAHNLNPIMVDNTPFFKNRKMARLVEKHKEE